MAMIGFHGIRIVINDEAETTANILKAAFDKAQIPFTQEFVRIEQCPIVHSPAVYVFVGEKP